MTTKMRTGKAASAINQSAERRVELGGHVELEVHRRRADRPGRQRAGPDAGTVDETLRIRGWGTDTFHVEASPTGRFAPIEEALVRTTPTSVTHEESDGETRLVNGNLTAVVERSGRVSFRSTTTGEELMGEPWFDPNEPPWHPHRRFLPVEARAGDDTWTLEATFAAYEGERIYGLGQHPLGRLDLKGTSSICCSATARSRPGPRLVARLRALLELPSIGRVELAQPHSIGSRASVATRLLRVRR